MTEGGFLIYCQTLYDKIEYNANDSDGGVCDILFWRAPASNLFRIPLHSSWHHHQCHNTQMNPPSSPPPAMSNLEDKMRNLILKNQQAEPNENAQPTMAAAIPPAHPQPYHHQQRPTPAITTAPTDR